MRMLPRLRRYARVLTGDDASADDLVVEALAKARAQRHAPALARVMAILHALHREHAMRRGQVTLRRLERALRHAWPAPRRNPVMTRLSGLPLEERAVLALVAVEQLAYTDVAEVLGVPVATAMAILVRARGHLRDGSPVTSDHAS
jgi:RNA polymerase sigma-70 factor (ECF subfamily)